MSPEERQLLEETVTLSRENNKILHQLRGALRWGRLYSVLKWLIIIGSTLGVYYYLQPYLFKVLDAYSSLLDGLNSVKEVSASADSTNMSDLSGLLKRFEGLGGGQ